MKIVISDLIGKPFEKLGILPGYNCWTLAKEVFSRYGVEVPDYRISAFDFVTIEETYKRDIKTWKRVKSPIEACLITMKLETSHVNHVAVYLGDGWFIHAYRGAKQVCRSSYFGIRGDDWLRITEGFYIPGW